MAKSHPELSYACVFLEREYCTKYQVVVEPNAQCDSYESIFLKGDRQYADP